MNRQAMIVIGAIISVGFLASACAVIYVPNMTNFSIPSGQQVLKKHEQVGKPFDNKSHKLIPEDTVWQQVNVTNPYTKQVKTYMVPEPAKTRTPHNLLAIGGSQ